MVTPTPLASGLPANLAIADRSRKFYDGTYDWDSQGFTDEHGDYREFDCLNPLGRAPTPLPPMFSDDEDDGQDQMDLTTSVPAHPLEQDTEIAPAAVAVEPDTPCPKPNLSTINTLKVRSPGSIRRFAIDFLANFEQSAPARQQQLVKESQHTSSITSNLEGIASATEQAGPEEALDRTHELLGEPLRTKNENSDMKMPDTPPESPFNATSGAQAISPASVISTLSSVPSNLSEQDKDIDIKIQGAPKPVQIPPRLPNNTPSKASARSETKASIRGVAQKVTKGYKRAASSNPRPPKRKDNSIEGLTLRELHAMASVRGRSLRRSVRQSKLEDD
ncbi:hypothetical protein SVAN01_09717 [Stagonosporopsis vannaccii]|nr:hypothetical protein SVAN01_09717 [Stagonosporopsis vannaccii]